MEKKKRVYISGKITGNPYARIQFEEAYRLLERRGYDPMSPFHAGQCMYSGMTHEEYMQVDLLLLSMADYICMLPNFIESEGAKAEFEFAVKKNKGLIDAGSCYRVVREPGWRDELPKEVLECEIEEI